MSEASIEGALLDRLTTLDFDQGEIAWPNLDFTQTTGTAWLRPTVLPAETQSPGAGSEDSDFHTGIFQVSVFYPARSGSLDAQRQADEIIAHFAKGTKMTRGGVTVQVRRKPWREAAQSEPDWYHVPVRIPYEAIIPA